MVLIMMEELKQRLDSLELLREPKRGLKVVGGLVAIYSLYKIARVVRRRRQYSHLPGPSLQSIFDWILGFHGTELGQMLKEGKTFGDILVIWQQRYGDTFKYYFFNEPVVFTADKQAVKDILITHDFPKDEIITKLSAYPLGERFFGRGLLTELDYEAWRHRRSIFNPGFHRHVLMTFVDQFNQKADILMERLRSLADGKTSIQLFKEINHATLDAIALIAFGLNMDSTSQMNPSDAKFSQIISELLKDFNDITLDPLARFKLSKRREIREKMNHLRAESKKILLNRLKALENKEPVSDDILNNILKSCKDDKLDFETMIDDFLTFFFAGQETTANTLAFCFLELGRHPDVVEKLREEIDRVVGERVVITHQDVNELRYCSAVFKESLRLWGPVPFLSRRSTKPLNINGLDVPANTLIVLSTYVSCRDEKNFKDAYEFRPERFVKDSGEEVKDNYVYYPFGLGPRNCIGQNFAHTEGVIMMAKLLQRFELQLDPNQSMAYVFEGTLKPKDGTRCFLTTRSA